MKHTIIYPETHKYVCKYCGKEYQPKKRLIQKYCSASCRVMACRDNKYGIHGLQNKGRVKHITNQQIIEKMEKYHHNDNKKLDSIKDHIHYIEIGIVLKFLFEWYQFAKMNQNLNTSQELRDILKDFIEKNPKIKDDLEKLSKSNPVYNELIAFVNVI
jgi:hypothetical protein